MITFNYLEKDNNIPSSIFFTEFQTAFLLFHDDDDDEDKCNGEEEAQKQKLVNMIEQCFVMAKSVCVCVLMSTAGDGGRKDGDLQLEFVYSAISFLDFIHFFVPFSML